MRMLADENFPKAIVEELRAEGHDVLWAASDCSKWDDTSLLDLAESESRILLTFDKDFSQIVTQRRVPLKQSGVVLFRVHPANAQTLKPLIRTFLESSNTWTGRVTVIAPGVIHLVPPRRK